jgi:hypothetical protein
MISKLTPKQENKISEYLNYWLGVGLRTETLDREKAKNAVDFLYTKILKMNKPKQYIFLDSPMACQLFLNGSNQLENQLRNQLENQLWNQLENQLRNQLENQLANQLRNQLANQLRNQLWNQLENQLANQLRNQLWNQLENQLRNQLWNQLRNQLENQLANQLENQLWNQLRSQKMHFIWESTTNWTQYYFWYCSCILNELFPEKKKDFGLFLEYLEHSKHYHYIYLSSEIAVFSDFPKTISINTEGQLDNEQEKALEYRDGYGFYASNGILARSSLELQLL